MVCSTEMDEFYTYTQTHTALISYTGIYYFIYFSGEKKFLSQWFHVEEESLPMKAKDCYRTKESFQC